MNTTTDEAERNRQYLQAYDAARLELEAILLNLLRIAAERPEEGKAMCAVIAASWCSSALGLRQTVDLLRAEPAGGNH